MTHAELIAALHRDPGNHDVLRALAMLAEQGGDVEAWDALSEAQNVAYKIRQYRQGIERLRLNLENQIAYAELEIREQQYRCPHPIRDGNLCLCCGHKE